MPKPISILITIRHFVILLWRFKHSMMKPFTRFFENTKLLIDRFILDLTGNNFFMK